MWFDTRVVGWTTIGLRLPRVGSLAFLALILFSIAGVVRSETSDDLVALDREALQLFRAGRYSDAVSIAQQAVTLTERLRGLDHPDVGMRLGALAEIYRELGRSTEAEPLFERAVTIGTNALGPNHPMVGVWLNNLGLVYYAQARYSEAETAYERAAEILVPALGLQHPMVAGLLNNVASLYGALSRYAEAETLYRKALEIGERENSAETYKTLNNFALLYFRRGFYAEAEPLLKRALVLAEKALGPDHPYVGGVLGNLAALYGRQGRYAEAEPLYSRALTVLEATFGDRHPAVAMSINNLAMQYSAQLRYADAEVLFKRALDIGEKALGPNHPEVCNWLLNLADAYRWQGRHTEAVPLLLRALSIAETALGPEHPLVGNVVNNLALIYFLQHRYAEAEPLFKRALQIATETLGPNHPNVGGALNNLAELHHQQGRIEEALTFVKRVLPGNFVNKLVAFPVLQAAQSKTLISRTDALAESYALVQRASNSLAGEALGKLAARFAAGTGELARLVRRQQDLVAEAGALDKALIETMSKPPAQRFAAAEQQLRNRMDTLKTEHDEVERQLFVRFPDYLVLSRPQLLSVAATQNLLDDNEALVILDFAARSYAWVITRTTADWVELPITDQELTRDVGKLRSSLSFDVDLPFDPSFAYQIYRKTFGAVEGMISEKPRISMVTNGAFTSLPPQVLVASDPAGKPLKDLDWLVRRHAITVWPSVTNLQVLRAKSSVSSAPKPLIAFGDPIFSKKRHEVTRSATRNLSTLYRGDNVDLAALAESLQQLPGTRIEIEAVGKVLKADPQDLKFGLDATETAVKQIDLAQYRIVYFATHGLVFGELADFAKNKAEPALALTFPNQPSEIDDGLLTASEVAQLKLNADWVVLSACNTADGDKPGAEALSGLARAFFYAGARSLIVSHWKIADVAAAKLMIKTFELRTLDSKLTHAQAVQKSMLTLLDEAKSDAEAHPRFWAPFSVVGEPVSKK